MGGPPETYRNRWGAAPDQLNGRNAIPGILVGGVLMPCMAVVSCRRIRYTHALFFYVVPL